MCQCLLSGDFETPSGDSARYTIRLVTDRVSTKVTINKLTFNSHLILISFKG